MAASSALAVDYHNQTTGTLNWSDDSMWVVNESSNPGQTPTINDTAYIFYNSRTADNPLDIYVDVDAAIKKLRVNYTGSATRLNLFANGATKGTTFKVDTAMVGASDALNINWGSGVTTKDGYLEFAGVSGSTVNLTNSLDSTNKIYIKFTEVGDMNSKTLVFGKDVAVNSTNHLVFLGGESGALAGGYNYIVDGTLTAKNGDTYKDITLGASNYGLNFTLNSNGVINANNLALESKCVVNINGKVNLMKSEDYSMGSGKLTISGNFNVGTNAFKFSGGELTIASNNAITAGSTQLQGSTADSVITIAKGITYNADILKFSTKQTLNVNGTLNHTLSDGGIINLNIGNEGTYVVKNRTGTSTWTIFGGKNVIDGKLVTTGFTDDSKIASGEMIVNEGAEIIHNGGRLMLDGYQNVWGDIGKKAILTINASNAFKKSETASQSSFSLTIFRGEATININADNQFNLLSFQGLSDAAQAAYLHLNVAEGAILELSQITGLISGKNSYLIFDIFGNNRIKVTNIGDVDISLISSADGNWKDFYFEQDNQSGGFWLNAIQVPEPSIYAMFLGALALGFATWRKRK